MINRKKKFPTNSDGIKKSMYVRFEAFTATIHDRIVSVICLNSEPNTREGFIGCYQSPIPSDKPTLTSVKNCKRFKIFSEGYELMNLSSYVT
jgi:hypothetical protein